MTRKFFFWLLPWVVWFPFVIVLRSSLQNFRPFKERKTKRFLSVFRMESAPSSCSKLHSRKCDKARDCIDVNMRLRPFRALGCHVNDADVNWKPRLRTRCNYWLRDYHCNVAAAAVCVLFNFLGEEFSITLFPSQRWFFHCYDCRFFAAVDCADLPLHWSSISI